MTTTTLAPHRVTTLSLEAVTAGFRSLHEVCRTDDLLTRPILVAPDLWRLAVEPALRHHRAEMRGWALAFAVYQRLARARPTLAPIACRVVVQDETGATRALRCCVWVRADVVVVAVEPLAAQGKSAR